MSVLSDAIQAGLAVAKSDLDKALLPALATFNTSLANDHSAAGVIAALAQLQASVLASVPTVEKDFFSAIANAISQAASSLTAPKA